MLKNLLDWLPFGAVPEISAVDLAAALGDGRSPQLLDIRSTAEWAQGHIAGARHLPIHRLGAAVGGLSFDRNRPVVTICLSAHRSIPAVRLLIRHGYADVRQLKGGMIAWRRDGLPVERG